MAIWALAELQRIPLHVQSLIADKNNSVSVSAASIWEISIKFSSARQGKPPFSGVEAIRLFRQAEFDLLAVTAEHGALAGSLPLRHADPFDRLIVAQSIGEPLRLVSADRYVAAYSETIITW